MSESASLRPSPGRFLGACLRTAQARFTERRTVWVPLERPSACGCASGSVGVDPNFPVDTRLTKAKWVILTLKSNREHIKFLDKVCYEGFKRNCASQSA
jgi:hypothetical protein